MDGDPRGEAVRTELPARGHNRVHVFGIRHHGPGSARALVQGLARLRPAAVLIELPADAASALSHAADPGLQPPVALLVYDPKLPARAWFYPFSVHSPEWQALRYAAEARVPVRAIDLPKGVALRELAEQDDSADESGAAPRTSRDPLDRIAALAGFEGGEAWWDAVVERSGDDGEVFEAVAALMQASREEHELHVAQLSESDPERRTFEADLRREAHMRLAVRAALREIDGDLAVVVGAWHVPALLRSVPARDDQSVLRGARPLAAAVTWVPWSEPRLASASGYGAGVTSPGWYRHLWEARGERDPRRSIGHWMSRAARLLREEGLPAATSSAIDATRLALMLADVRGVSRPGLAEVEDAALAALCNGEPAPLRVIARRLVVGEQVGVVPEGIPQMPLAEDLAREQRRTRLTPEASERELALDLRTDSGRARSRLLHRLRLLPVRWGALVDANAGRGTYREVWRLHWTPELAVELAEALRFGTTIATAAETAVRTAVGSEQGLGALAQWVEGALAADLPSAAAFAIERLQHAATLHVDVAAAMDAAAPLAEVVRYGSARSSAQVELRSLVETLCAQGLAGFVFAARGIAAEAAEALVQRMPSFERALAVLEEEHLQARWLAVLAEVAHDPGAAPAVAGAAARRCSAESSERAWSEDELARVFSFRLSGAVEAAGQWLAGFLGADAEVLLHEQGLLRILDVWLAGLSPEDFLSVLPILRRSFTPFDEVQRRRLFRALSAVESAPSAQPPLDLSPSLLAAAPLLYRILGLEGGEREQR